MAKQRKLWVADDIKVVANLWESKTTREIAEQLGRSPASIQQLACMIRKTGYELKRKRMVGTLQNLIKETLGTK